jgi:hypothetical protein
VLKQQAMPVPAVIVPVYTMEVVREGTCRLKQMVLPRQRQCWSGWLLRLPVLWVARWLPS